MSEEDVYYLISAQELRKAERLASNNGEEIVTAGTMYRTYYDDTHHYVGLNFVTQVEKQRRAADFMRRCTRFVKAASTRQLLGMRYRTVCLWDGGPVVPTQMIYAELDLREHVPNKAEGTRARKAAAKTHRGGGRGKGR